MGLGGYMIYVVALCMMIFESLWRRNYGGGLLAPIWKKTKWLKWLNFRFVLTILNIAVIGGIGYHFRLMEWYWSLTMAAVYMIYWCLAHGPWFDCGRDEHPSEKMIERYNKVWFAPILNWCFSEEHRYGHFYDFCGMLIRYTWPLFFIIFLPTCHTIGILLLGELVAITYSLCHVARERCVVKNIGSTELAEFIVGGITGLFIVLI